MIGISKTMSGFYFTFSCSVEAKAVTFLLSRHVVGVCAFTRFRLQVLCSKLFHLKGSPWSFWPLAALWNSFSMRRSCFCSLIHAHVENIFKSALHMFFTEERNTLNTSLGPWGYKQSASVRNNKWKCHFCLFTGKQGNFNWLNNAVNALHILSDGLRNVLPSQIKSK